MTDRIALAEELALATALDQAAQRLHDLCGTRSDAPRWDDIAAILRERERLYAELRRSPPANETAGLREATIEECAKVAEFKFAGSNLNNIGGLVAADIRALALPSARMEGERGST